MFRAQVTQTALVFFIMVRIYTCYKHGEDKAHLAEEKERQKREEDRSLLSNEADRMIIRAAETFLRGAIMGHHHLQVHENEAYDREHV